MPRGKAEALKVRQFVGANELFRLVVFVFVLSVAHR